MNTFFKNIHKTQDKVKQVHMFDPDTTIKNGDVTEMIVPTKGPFISTLYINLFDTPYSSLEYLQLYYNDVQIFNFSGVYSMIQYYVRTPLQKQLLSDSVLSFDLCNIPVLEGMKIRFKVNGISKTYEVFADFVYTKQNKDGKYLIEQMQRNTFFNPPSTLFLNFKHCVKEMFFTLDGFSSSDKFSNMKLLLNNVEKCSDSPKFFRLVQPLIYHTTAPTSPNYFYMYSFCLNPENIIPSGSINLSRIQNVNLNITYTQPVNTLDIYTTSYNYFIVKDGEGKLLFPL